MRRVCDLISKFILALRRSLIKFLYDQKLRRSEVKCGKGYIKHSKNTHIIGITATTVSILLATMAIFPIVKHQDQAEATPIASNTNLSITSASTIASVDITPTSSTGTFSSSDASNEVAFSVTTNNLTGYNLTLAARSGDTSGQLTNVSYSDTLDSIASPVDETTFATGPSTTYTNKWGIKPSKYLSANNTDFIPAPITTSGFIIDTTTGPNTTANTYTIGIGARVDYEKPTGTYTNTYVLEAVGRPVAYEIQYIDNLSGSEVQVITTESGTSAISAVTLSSTIPTREGFVFNKWCYGTVNHVSDGVTDGNSTCSGTQYSAGQNFIPSTSNVSKLYAMWNVVSFSTAYANAGKEKVEYNTSTYYTMQDMELNNICKKVSNGQTITLLDVRDNRRYTVAKISGNCWMTRNLRFTGASINSSTSNINKTVDFTASSDPRYYLSNSTNCIGADSGTGAGMSHYCYYDSGSSLTGTYYNYKYATAGTISGTGEKTAVANYSICPKGWGLPTYDVASTIADHSDKYLSIFRVDEASPGQGIGQYQGGGSIVATNRSYWWTATVFTDKTTNRYTINYYSPQYITDTGGSGAPYLAVGGISSGIRSAGNTIRCVAK